MLWESRLEEHPDYVKAIGMIAIETTSLEYFLSKLFSNALFLPKDVGAAIFLTPKSSAARLDIMENAAEAALRTQESKKENAEEAAKKEAALGKLISVVKRSRGLMNKRHNVMHSVWAFSESHSHVAYVSLPPKGEKPGILMPLQDLTEIIRNLRSIITEVQDLTEVFAKNPPGLVSMKISPD